MEISLNKINLLVQLHDSSIQNSLSITLILVSISIVIIVINLERKFKRINDNLFYREELFNSLCSNIDEAFIIFDVINKKIEYISPNFENILGFNAAEISQNHFKLLDNISLDNKNEIYEMILTSVIKCNMEIEFEYNHPRLHQKRWMTMRIYPANNYNNVFRYIISIVDATKEKEAQLVINEALINVQKANEAKKDFLSHMSHELKTPINAIVGMAQIASKSLNDNEKVENCLTKINFASKSLLEIINNILDIAKYDNDKIILVNEPLHLSSFISSFSSLMNSQAEVNNQEYNLIVNNLKDEYVIGDSLRLMQILGNCLSNSFKFTPSNGKITLEVTEISRQTNKVYYRFIISDNGKGMNEDYIERIFIPFEQEDSTIAKNYGGTGLGMSITKNLIVLMGGTIHVESKKTTGTTITIDLPFDFMEEPSTEELIPDASNYNNTEVVGKQKRVLVVEDNEINLEITSEFLNYIKINVVTALNGYEALNLFEDSQEGYFDAILMDIHMPRLNGYETAKAIRSSAHPDANKVCIIAMTADNYADNQSILDCGMNYHIAKPIDIGTFNLLLQNAISEEEILN
ncbi:MAG: hybrid sensor histidine kinase/response regulator [Herbinix sp.]|jgi:PAS domain S-box-containing protein|nr:hybrid sensor histidine kinase/response regulator [Herbinix sp.]